MTIIKHEGDYIIDEIPNTLVPEIDSQVAIPGSGTFLVVFANDIGCGQGCVRLRPIDPTHNASMKVEPVESTLLQGFAAASKHPFSDRSAVAPSSWTLKTAR